MKRMIQYALIALQIVLMIVIVYQFENMEKYAEEINIVTKIDYMYYGGFAHNSDLYVDYDINKINEEAWSIDEPLHYNRPVYVTLVKNNEGIHEVKKVTKKKPKNQGPNDVITKANYHYDDKGQRYVYYGFEFIPNTERFGTFREGEQLLVTVLLGKWGQQKVVKIETK